MRDQGAGRIINIGSVLGFLPLPYVALYSASKHAIEGYTESLDHELRNMGIRVSVIEPASVNTPFGSNAVQADSKSEKYAAFREAMVLKEQEMMKNGDDPAVIVDVILKAAKDPHPKIRYAAGAAANRFRRLRRWAPAALVDAGVRKDLGLHKVVEPQKIAVPQEGIGR